MKSLELFIIVPNFSLMTIIFLHIYIIYPKFVRNKNLGPATKNLRLSMESCTILYYFYVQIHFFITFTFYFFIINQFILWCVNALIVYFNTRASVTCKVAVSFLLNSSLHLWLLSGPFKFKQLQIDSFDCSSWPRSVCFMHMILLKNWVKNVIVWDTCNLI